MEIIDSHIHFWDVGNGFNKWVENTYLPKLVTPENLNANAFVHIEAHGDDCDPLCEYNWLKSKFSDKNIRIVAFADFTLSVSEFEKKIEYLSQNKDIVGIRHIMSKTYKSKYSPFDKDIPKDLRQKLKVLKEYNLIFEAQMYPEQFLPLLDEISNSDVNMVVEHFGLPLFGRNNNLDQWYKFIKEVAQNSSWTLKLSGFDLNNRMNDVTKALDFIFEKITFHQLCYGSNFPVSHQNDYSYWSKFLKGYINNNDIAKHVFENVARRVYFNN
jgi:predicted TIM-barrel fold metal-dependent hydrolase